MLVYWPCKPIVIGKQSCPFLWTGPRADIQAHPPGITTLYEQLTRSCDVNAITPNGLVVSFVMNYPEQVPWPNSVS